MTDLYLMSPPPPGWALRARANFRSREAAPVDAARARIEWLRFARELERRGGQVVVLPPPSDALTGMPYAAECGQIVVRAEGPHLFVLPRMLSAHRQPEREHWAPLARALGFEVVDPGAGVWEAQGDVAVFDGVTLLFHGGRTDAEGMEAAARHFEGELLRLRVHEPAFHGNMAALPLPAVDRILVCPAVFEQASLEALVSRFGRERLIEVTEVEIRHYATNGLPVGRELLAPSLLPERVRRVVEDAGMEVVLLPMGELCDKGGGASRCLVSHARLPGWVALPAQYTLDAAARQIEGAA